MTSIDTPRVRRDILIEAQTLAQRIDLVEDELELYRERDLPAFNAWFEERFGDERAHLRQLEGELSLIVRRHNDVVALAKMHDLSMERAYRMVVEEDLAFARGNPATRRHIREERSKREHLLREDLEREVRDRLGAVHEASPVPTPAEPPADGDLKTIYRRLVRRLHPDVQRDLACPNELRWQRRVWSLLQGAYENGDAGTLRHLYRVTLLRQMDFAELTLADAREAFAWLSRELGALEAERDRARERPSWGFGAVTDFDALLARVREEFRLDINSVRAEIDEISGQHEYLALLDKSTTKRTGVIAVRPRRGSDPASINQLSFFD